MASYDNTNTGALFKNTRRTNDRQPEFTGKLNVAGQEFYVSGWRKSRDGGDPFISLAIESKADVEAKKAARAGGQAPAPKAVAKAELDDAIPF